MPYGKYAECPCCGKKAFGDDEIELEFGFRTMANDKEIPQSYCKVCRASKCEAGKPKH